MMNLTPTHRPNPLHSPATDQRKIGHRSRHWLTRLAGAGVASVFLVLAAPAPAAIVASGLSVHYDAANADGNGNAGIDLTNPTAIVNLAQNAHDGRFNNGIGFVENAGEPIGSPFRHALAFDGVDDFLDLDGGSRFSLTGADANSKVTFEFWLMVTDKPEDNRQGLFGEFDADSFDTRNYVHLADGGSAGDDVDNNAASFDQYQPSGGAASSGTNLFQDGAFMQLALVKDGSNVTWYIDGLQVDSATTNESFSGGGVDTTMIGARSNNSSLIDLFQGQMSIVRIYDDTALNGPQIQQNYDATIPEPATLALLGLGGALLLGRRRTA